MKRRLLITGVVLAFLLAVLGVFHWFSVVSYVKAQEKIIKEELRASMSEYPLYGWPDGLSNSSDGVERFLETGELVVERGHFLYPRKIRERQLFNFRVHPRASKERVDGWVGKQQHGHWYVKMP